MARSPFICIFPFCPHIQNLSSNCTTDMIMWNIPEAKKRLNTFEKWEVIPKAVKTLSFSPSPSLLLSLSLPLQPFSIISAQTSLLKRAKLKPQFSKLQNSIINAQLSLRLYWVQAWGETNILQLTHAYTHIQYICYTPAETPKGQCSEGIAAECVIIRFKRVHTFVMRAPRSCTLCVNMQTTLTHIHSRVPS